MDVVRLVAICCFTAAAILAAPAVHATTAATWSGPGPNACNLDGNGGHTYCPDDWAMAQLTDAQREELSLQMQLHPEGRVFLVNDGDVFAAIAYQRDGEPYMQRSTIARLTEPEIALGWQMDGWSFGRLIICGNPIRIDHAVRVPVQVAWPDAWERPVQPPAMAARTSTPTPCLICTTRTPHDPETPHEPHDPPAPVIPLPASMWMLLAAILGLSSIAASKKARHGANRAGKYSGNRANAPAVTR